MTWSVRWLPEGEGIKRSSGDLAVPHAGQEGERREDTAVLRDTRV